MIAKNENHFIKRRESKKLLYARGVKIKHVAKRRKQKNLKGKEFL